MEGFARPLWVTGSLLASDECPEELLARVVETQALEQPQMTKETRASWLDDYKVGQRFHVRRLDGTKRRVVRADAYRTGAGAGH